MPRQKRSVISTQSAVGNSARGTGARSRISLDINKLREAGWSISQEERTSSSGTKVFFRYVNPEGKTVKSSKDVERQLREEGIYESFTTSPESDNEMVDVECTQQSASHSDGSDSDYEPPEKLVHEEKLGERWVCSFIWIVSVPIERAYNLWKTLI